MAEASLLSLRKGKKSFSARVLFLLDFKLFILIIIMVSRQMTLFMSISSFFFSLNFKSAL